MISMTFETAEEKYKGTVILKREKNDRLSFNHIPARIYKVAGVKVISPGVALDVENYLDRDAGSYLMTPNDVVCVLADDYTDFEYRKWVETMGYDLELMRKRFELYNRFMEIRRMMAEDFHDDVTETAITDLMQYEELRDKICLLHELARDIYNQDR